MEIKSDSDIVSENDNSLSYPVLITYSNYGYINFAKNLISNLADTVKNHKVHFYCLDEETYKSLTEFEKSSKIDIKFELLKVNISKNFENYGSHNYNKITHTKVNLLKNALKKYNFIHFIDCDVVCIKEPSLEHYRKYKNYDIVFQYDCGLQSIDKLHNNTLHNTWACTGNTSFRNTPKTHYILDTIMKYQQKYTNKNDQECLLQYFNDSKIDDLRNYKKADLFTYNPDEYTNGYWLKHDIGTLKNTYFFHANHVEGSKHKIDLLKKAGKWIY
jgi:hypothetical protein